MIIKVRSYNLHSGVMYRGVTSFLVMVGWNDKEYVTMLWTGLKDKNGVEIYEKDIVTFLNFRGSVYWCELGFWAIKWINAPHLNEKMFTFKGSSGFKVIGNIYQDPEILNESN